MPLQPRSPLPRFLLGLLIIMPFTMAVWWVVLRDHLVIFLQQGGYLFTQVFMPEKVLGISTEVDAKTGAAVWVLKTTLSPLSDPRQLLAIPISTSRFTVSFPLFWGLVLATPGQSGAAKARQLGLGTLALIPLTLLIAVLILQFKLALHVNHQPIVTENPIGDYLLVLPYGDTAYYLMAVGRQLAMLVLPTLIPLMTWGLFNRGFIRSVIVEGLLSQGLRRAGAVRLSPPRHGG